MAARASTAATEASPRTSGSPPCFRCRAAAERSCTLCGQFYCRRHGGARLVLGPSGQLLERFVCDECTPNQVVLKRLILGVTLLIGGAVLIAGLVLSILRP